MCYKLFGAAAALASLGLIAAVHAEMPETVPLPPVRPAEFAKTVVGSALSAQKDRSVEIMTTGADQAGSGVLLNDSWVLSALHVFTSLGNGAVDTEVLVKTVESEKIRKMVISGDVAIYQTSTDLVLIKLRQPLAGVAPVKLAPNAAEGEECYLYSTRRLGVWGNCLLQAELQPGDKADNLSVPGNFRFTSFVAMGGDSGSALYNNDGELQGIMSKMVGPEGMDEERAKALFADASAARLDKDFPVRFRPALRNIVVDLPALRWFLCEAAPRNLQLPTC